MPLYDFECSKCEKDFEYYCRLNMEREGVCPECGGYSKKSVIKHKARAECWEYYEEQLGCMITGPQDLKEKMKIYGAFDKSKLGHSPTTTKYQIEGIKEMLERNSGGNGEKSCVSISRDEDDSLIEVKFELGGTE